MTRNSYRLLFITLMFACTVGFVVYAYLSTLETGDHQSPRSKSLRTLPEYTALVSSENVLGTIGDIAPRLNLSADLTSATLQLSSETVFATGLIGEAALVPASEAAFRLITQQPGADEIFLALFYASDTTNEGRVQALRGLWHVNPAAYAEIVSSIRNSRILITTMHGCIVKSAPVAEVLTEIEMLPLVQWHTSAHLNRYTMEN